MKRFFQILKKEYFNTIYILYTQKPRIFFPVWTDGFFKPVFFISILNMRFKFFYRIFFRTIKINTKLFELKKNLVKKKILSNLELKNGYHIKFEIFFDLFLIGIKLKLKIGKNYIIRSLTT